MKRFLLGIDIGSGGCKVTLLDMENQIHYIQANEYPTYYPKPGWAEQNPDDWIEAIGTAIKSLFAKFGVSSRDIEAIGISGVTHSPVLLDKSGKVLRPVIHLTDTRSIDQVQWLRQKAGHLIQNATFNFVSAMWTLPMLLWIRENEANIWKRISKVLFPKDYIRFKLTGSYVTDRIDAAGTLLFNVKQNTWDDKLMELTGIKPVLFPQVLEATDIAGQITNEGSLWSHLAPKTPVIVGTTDTALEVYSAGSLSPGDCTVKLATFGRICVIHQMPKLEKGLINYPYILPGLWYPGTGTKSCASSLRWVRDQFCRDIEIGEGSFAVMDKEAECVPPGSKGLLFHPYLVGEDSPYVDPYLRGDFVGLTLHHTRAHLIRSVMEGTAFSLLDNMRFIEERGIKINEPLRFIGGGTRSHLWTSILADVLGKRAIIPPATDPSFGAALLAGVGVGVYKTAQEALNFKKGKVREICPDQKRVEIYRKLFYLYKETHDRLADIYRKLSINFS